MENEEETYSIEDKYRILLSIMHIIEASKELDTFDEDINQQLIVCASLLMERYKISTEEIQEVNKISTDLLDTHVQ